MKNKVNKTIILACVCLLITCVMVIQHFNQKHQDTEQIHKKLDAAIVVANSAFDDMDPASYKKGIDALNAIPNADNYVMDNKMMVLQALFDAAIDRINSGLDASPADTAMMQKQYNEYSVILTKTNVPEFNAYAKDNFANTLQMINDTKEQEE